VISTGFAHVHEGTQRAAASATKVPTYADTTRLGGTSTAGFSYTFDLPQATTLAFGVSTITCPTTPAAWRCITALPEPGRMATLCAGLAALAWARRRRGPR